MNNIKYLSDKFLDEFKTNFEQKYLPLYVNNDIQSINDLFTDSENVIDSDTEFCFRELILESEVPGAQIENLKIIWESLKNLSVAEAESEKIWVALENTYYLNYHLDQLELLKGAKREQSIKSRTIFSQGKKRSLMINSIASLWWIAYYTYDDSLTNPYYYSERFLSGSYRGNAVAYFSSNLVSNKNIVLGTLQAIYELVDEGLMKENRYSYTNANKILNLIGGVVVLDFLTRAEIKEIVKENLLNMENIMVLK